VLITIPIMDSMDIFNGVAKKLLLGGVGVMPSDTIYGLSCLALDKKAVERIYKLKGRDSKKPVIVLISNLQMLDLLSIDKAQAEVIKKYWPGALSVVFPAANSPKWLTRGSGSLAVRWPKNPELCELIDKVGPIVSTSANPENQKPASSIDEAKEYFGNSVGFYIDGGELDSEASTIAELKDGELNVIRPGAVRI
jgi:L-threonylcarbamoyladenylate synthase